MLGLTPGRGLRRKKLRLPPLVGWTEFAFKICDIRIFPKIVDFPSKIWIWRGYPRYQSGCPEASFRLAEHFRTPQQCLEPLQRSFGKIQFSSFFREFSSQNACILAVKEQNQKYRKIRFSKSQPQINISTIPALNLSIRSSWRLPGAWFDSGTQLAPKKSRLPPFVKTFKMTKIRVISTWAFCWSK